MDNQFEDLLDKMNEADEPATNREEDLAGKKPKKDILKPQHTKAEEIAYNIAKAAEVDEANMFAADRIESLEAKIAELDKLAKGCRKGQEQSSIYARIDALEAELTKARIEAEE